MIKCYDNYLVKIKDYMKENNYEIQAKPLISKMGAYMGINMEVMKDNSDSRMADMLIQGLNMGVINVTKKIDTYKGDVPKEVLSLAKEFKKFQEEGVEFLKKYL